MGWFYSTSWNRRLLIEELIEKHDWTVPETGIRCVNKIIAHCLRGNNLWKVVESFRYDKTGAQIFHGKWIELDMLQNGGKDFGWGHKSMDESCGPYSSSCPLSYLDMVKDFPAKGYAAEFRERVREYHKLQKERRKKLRMLYQPAKPKGF